MTAQAAALERINPVLLKEVRAALRARVFRILFQIVMLISVVVAVFALADLDPYQIVPAGKSFFQPVYLCLCVALLGLVPFSAFFSMGSEWDENTYDLLAIADLRPRQIVLGKLASAAIEALLYFSAFAPLLVMTFLLRGIGIGTLLIVLSVTYVASVGAAATAIGISSLARTRALRVLLLAVVGLASLGLIILLQALVWDLLWDRGVHGTVQLEEFVLSVLALTAGAGAIGVAVACERLAHPEENHSTGPRVTVTVLYALYLAWAVWSMSARWYFEGAAIGLVLVSLAHILFATERETLTRRVRRQVPLTGGLALLAVPFLPGGGRALFLFVIHVLMALVPLAVDPRAFAHERDAFLVFAGYLFVYLAALTLPFSPGADETRRRWIARVVVPLVVFLSICLPAIVGFMISHKRWVDMEHPLNPYHVFDSSTRAIGLSAVSAAVATLVVVVFLANLLRLDRAWREVLQASRENRARVEKTP